MSALDDAARARDELLWSKTSKERVEAFYRGEFSLRDCLEWASKRPNEPPRAPDGEFLFIAIRTPEWLEDVSPSPRHSPTRRREL